MSEVDAMTRTTGPFGLLVVMLSFVLVQTAHAQGEEVLYWPVPDHEDDVRGTFGDYRPEYPWFHKGIDILAPAGTEVSPVVDYLTVSTEPLFDERKGWQFIGSDLYMAEQYLYAHIQKWTAQGDALYPGMLLIHGSDDLLIYDFEGDGATSNDHLHFQVGMTPALQYWRNPLWANDNPYRELDGADADDTPPTIVAIAFATYGYPYDLANILYGCTGITENIMVPDNAGVDILVYARDDAGKVGVRGLKYAVTDVDDEDPNDDWIPFCDLTHDVFQNVDYEKVFAFMADEGQIDCDVLTQHVDPPDDDRMWYMVDSTSGTVNSFVTHDWLPDDLVGDQTRARRKVWIEAMDAACNWDTTSVVVTVYPGQEGDPPATFWVRVEGEDITARWTRTPGNPVEAYQIWISYPQGGTELLLTVEANEEGEEAMVPYCVTVPGGPRDANCVYRLEAVAQSQITVPLAWARATR